jgi:hypothetical protein
MAIKVEIFKNYELNGKIYSGNFPIYSSDAVCENLFDEEDIQEEDISEGNAITVLTQPINLP